MQWAQIHKLYRLDTGHETKKMLRYAEYRLANAPKITSTTRDSVLKIMHPEGHNATHEGIKYQTDVVLVISDYLIGRTVEQTNDELLAFEEYITETLGWKIIVDQGGVW